MSSMKFGATSSSDPTLKIGVLVVAYNAEAHLAATLDRVPADFAREVAAVLVADDASADDTYEIGIDYAQKSLRNGSGLPIEVVRHPVNLGYGGNQKAGYRWAIESGIDIIVMLHADGQYAPEFLPQMVSPLLKGEADVVFGSRMLTPGEARRGGMPMYKFVGNRILTTYQNAVTGSKLSEWHSGYRAYSVEALKNVPFERNSDGFDFDTEIILQLIESSARIVEIPIPTFYGNEICHVNGLAYAWDVASRVTQYRLHKIGFGSGDLAFLSEPSEVDPDDESASAMLRDWLLGTPGRSVLHLSATDDRLASDLQADGYDVTTERLPTADEPRQDARVESPEGYDLAVCIDALQYVADPLALLNDVRGRLGPGGSLMISVPNFGHWYPRLRVALGFFDYDVRGILDSRHVRFFTRRTLDRLVHDAGFTTVRSETVGLPLEVGGRGTAVEVPAGPTRSRLRRLVRAVDKALVRLRPQLFGYQFVYELRPAPATRSAERSAATDGQSTQMR